MKRIFITALLAFVGNIGFSVQAETVISNIGGASVGGNTISASTINTLLFQMNAGNNYRLDSVSTLLNSSSETEADAQTTIEIRNHASDTDPLAGSLVAVLNPNPLTGTAFGGTLTTVTFTPAAPIQLNSNTKYWVVVRGLNNNSLQMNRTATTPVGTAGIAISSYFYNGAWINMSTSSNEWATIAINASPNVTAANIPTLSEWGMIFLSGLLTLGTVVILRRQGL